VLGCGNKGEKRMAKRAISTPVREAILLPDGMAITLSDNPSLPLSELVIEVSFRCAPDATRPAEVNQGTILTFARDALTAQIEAITKAHGPIPHELPGARVGSLARRDDPRVRRAPQFQHRRRSL
jgi:hypothetical protein